MIPDEIITPEVKNTIEKWEQYDKLVIVAKDIPEYFSVQITKELVKRGVLSIFINEEEAQNLQSTTTNYELPVLFLSKNDRDLVLIRNDKTVSLSEELFISNFEELFKNLLGDIFIFDKRYSLSDIPETIVYDPIRKEVFLANKTGIPLIVINSDIEFLPGYRTIDGSLYINNVLYTQTNVQYQIDELPLLNNGFSILTREYTVNLRDGRKQENTAQPIFAWGKILIFADGQISDLSLNWKMKISNAPVDFVVLQDKLYILDLTNNIYIFNLKTRKITHVGTVENNGRLKDNGAEVVLITKDSIFTVKEEGISQVKDYLPNFQGNYNVNKIYPTICDVEIYSSGFFYNNTFIGNEMYFSYLSDGVITILTDVGTWRIREKR
ncbi:hypothetical protein [Fervidobacterium sp.]